MGGGAAGVAGGCARHSTRAVRHQGLVRPSLSDSDGLAGRGRGQEGLLCRQRRRDGYRVDRGLAGHAGGGGGLAQYHAQHLQRRDQLHRVGRRRRPSVAGVHGHSSRRRGREKRAQERERTQGQGGRHLVDQVRLDHSPAPAAESARARAVGLRRGRRAGQRADFQRAAGGRARRGLAGAAAVAHGHDGRLSGDRDVPGGCTEIPVRLLRHQRCLAEKQYRRGAGLRQGLARRRCVALRSRQPRRSREAVGRGAQAFARDRRRDL